jgi:hypothetical protein
MPLASNGQDIDMLISVQKALEKRLQKVAPLTSLALNCRATAGAQLDGGDGYSCPPFGHCSTLAQRSH